MEADRTEMNNLAAAEPERVKKMGDMWQAYGERTNVLPWPGSGRKKPKKDPKEDAKKKGEKK
jgi:hypothetical protein